MKSSFDFADEVVNYDQSLCMANLDVELLFINISLEEIIKNCVNNLYFNNSYCVKLTRIGVFDLFNLLLNDLLNPLSPNFPKWSKTLKQLVSNMPTNCLSVFDHFVGLALKELIFDNKLCKEIDAAAMNSPLRPVLTNAFFCHYEKIWLNECPPQFKLAVYRCCAGNIFVLLKSNKHLKVFVYCLNSKQIYL